MKIKQYSNGLTVKELKEYLKDVPDIDEVTGEPTTVWLQSGFELTSPCHMITPIDRTDIGLYYSYYGGV
jgi:hypothetical protein